MSGEKRYPCVCCGYLTLSEPGGSYEICHVCFWEADPVQNHDPSFAGGANKVSLREARRNYQKFGASERRLLRHVRPPRSDEYPPPADSDV
jgi:hypothetical protein